MKSMKTKKAKKSIQFGPVDDLTREDLRDENVKMRISIFFDLDLVKHFKAEAKKSGEKYQTLMNRAMREAAFGKEKDELRERLARLEKAVFKTAAGT